MVNDSRFFWSFPIWNQGLYTLARPSIHVEHFFDYKRNNLMTKNDQLTIQFWNYPLAFTNIFRDDMWCNVLKWTIWRTDINQNGSRKMVWMHKSSVCLGLTYISMLCVYFHWWQVSLVPKKSRIRGVISNSLGSSSDPLFRCIRILMIFTNGIYLCNSSLSIFNKIMNECYLTKDL